MKRIASIGLVLCSVVLPGLLGCSGGGQDDPRQVVISFFGAMERNDQAALAHLLDLASLMKNTTEDYAVTTDQPRVFTNPQDILNDLTNDGYTKTRWFALQRIINDAYLAGDNATVEVTFVDKKESHGYRTRFGLRKMNGKWRIYSFKTFE
jgi:hypothetical protein